jgi:creatinine amidohydrolase/Fe(II)-dependent formamide hydrolase-like protein
VAPTIQYVPEGNPDRQNPGCISLPSPAYDQLLDATARSLRAHGFKEIIFIGDSGGNQSGMTAVATALNEAWKGQDVKVFALTDYYNQGRDNYRAWMEAAFGYDDQTVGSHAGISDTSQLLHVRPSMVRKDQIKPWGGPADSGVSGDPMKATAEIGRMGLSSRSMRALPSTAHSRITRGRAGDERVVSDWWASLQSPTHRSPNSPTAERQRQYFFQVNELIT